MDIIVIGCGVSGLSCGIRLIEAGFGAQIWARALPPHTTSNVAAAVWYPYKAYPEALVGRWAAATYADFVQLAQVEGAGVMVREGLEIFPYPAEDPWWRDALPGFRRAAPGVLPAGYVDGYVFEAPVIEMPVYLSYLMRRFEGLGGRIHTREVRALGEVFERHDAAVNCTGLGARELLGDMALHAIRGQIVRVAQVGIERFLLDDHGPGGVTYIVPRANDCVLGARPRRATKNWSPTRPRRGRSSSAAPRWSRGCAVRRSSRTMSGCGRGGRRCGWRLSSGRPASSWSTTTATAAPG